MVFCRVVAAGALPLRNASEGDDTRPGEPLFSGRDFKGLRKLRDALGDRLIAGVALSTGLRSYTFEDRLHVMPLDRLWRPVQP